MKIIIEHLQKNWLRYSFDTLVVVVGVLIAFTLNNWNENGKSKAFEQKLELELYNSIQDDIPILEMAISQTEKNRQSAQIVLDYIEEDMEYHDSLKFHFASAVGWWNIDIKAAAYETAKTYGLHFLNDDTTRILLADVYERHLPFIHKLEQRQQDYSNFNVIPILTEHFDIIPTGLNREMKPHDYEVLKNDKRYRTIIKTNIQKREFDLYFIKNLLNILLEIQERIGKEINELI